MSEISALIKNNESFFQGEIETATADGTALAQFADGAFSVVYSLSVLEHIEDPTGAPRALAEMARVTRAGGTIVLSTPVDTAMRKEFKHETVYDRGFAGEPVFFQLVYDAVSLRALVESVPSLEVADMRIVEWNQTPLLNFWRKVPQKIRGLGGVINLLLAPGAADSRAASWPNFCIGRAGDIIIRLRKRS
jgi:SAM-dependent methyltransferase